MNQDEQTSTTNLERLLSLIHTEGLEKAKSEAARILNEAQAEAERIKENARHEAHQAQLDAKKRIERTEAAQQERLSMAARDLLLQLSEQLTQGFERFTAETLKAQLNAEVLAPFLKALAQALPEERQWSALLAKEDLNALEEALQAGFIENLQKNLELQGDDQLKAGLMLYESGAQSFLDFSAPALAQRLTRHLSPKLKELWAQATGDLGGTKGGS